MGDRFYDIVVFVGRIAFFTSSRPRVVNPKITRRSNAYLLAANHTSAYDVPILMRHTARRIDFVSIAEVFRNRFVAWFYGSMNAFPLDRGKADGRAVRTILDRLSRGRVVGIFPEGGFRRGERSVLNGGPIKPGTARLARLAGVPIVPCAILNSIAYQRFAAWLPVFATRYSIIYGEPIDPALDESGDAATDARLKDALRSLAQNAASAADNSIF